MNSLQRIGIVGSIAATFTIGGYTIAANSVAKEQREADEQLDSVSKTSDTLRDLLIPGFYDKRIRNLIIDNLTASGHRTRN